MKQTWLYLHFPQLQLDSLMMQQSYQPETALLVVEPTHMQIMQCNSIAMAAGITTEMSLGAAATLCPNLQVQAYEPKVERDKRQEVADKLYSLTSDISFFAATDLLLRANTMVKLYGGLQPYWLAIRHQLKISQVTYHYALATTPLAARLLALSRWDHLSEHPESVQQRLLNCTLHLTDLDKKAVQKLNKVGVRKVKQLINIPLADIAKRFSYEFAEYLGRLQGTLPHPVNFYHPAANFERYMELLHDVTSAPALIPPLVYLLKAMEQFLKLRDCLAMQLIIHLHQREHQPLVLSVGTQQGEYRVSAWQYLIELQLEKISLQAPVFALTLHIEESHLRTPEHTDLFDKQRSELTRLQLIAILQAKLGEQAVHKPFFNNTHVPEQASQYKAIGHSQHNTDIVHSMRPIFLLPQPTPLTCKVSIKHGPERIQTGWWQHGDIERDYFIAQSSQGQWLWVFRTAQQKWYLHGVFS